MNSTRTSPISILARIIAVILAALFVVTALATLVLFNIERQAFNPATYKRALVDRNFYQQFPLLLGDLLVKNLGNSAPAFMQRLTADQWKNMVETLLPEQQLRGMTEESINQVLAYLNGETQTPMISMIPIKQSLAGPAGLDAALTIIHAQPDCTLQQIAAIIASLGQGELCNPPKSVLDLFQPFIQSELQAAAGAIPDNVLIIPGANSPSQQANLEILQLMRLIIRLSPLIPLVLLLGTTILAVRSFQSWLAWWGWPLMLTGLPGMFIGFGGAPFFRAMAERSLSKNLNSSLPPEIINSIRALVDAALREMLKPAGWESVAIFIVGLLMIVLAAFLASRQRKKIAASEAATQIFPSN
jgi:hypothetical protein